MSTNYIAHIVSNGLLSGTVDIRGSTGYTRLCFSILCSGFPKASGPFRGHSTIALLLHCGLFRGALTCGTQARNYHIAHANTLNPEVCEM